MYENLINMPRPVSHRHAPMTLYNRAAQFTPFSALTGLDGELAEAGRLTQSDMELTQERIAELDRSLRRALEQNLPITVTFFVPDDRKSGGSLQTVTACVRKILPAQQLLLLDNGIRLPVQAIREIECVCRESL